MPPKFQARPQPKFYAVFEHSPQPASMAAQARGRLNTPDAATLYATNSSRMLASMTSGRGPVRFQDDPLLPLKLLALFSYCACACYEIQQYWLPPL